MMKNLSGVTYWCVTLFSIVFLSGCINVLALTGSFYMMQIYDRVLSSKSLETLYVISGLTLFLFVCQGIIEIFRSRIMLRIGNFINEYYLEKVYHSIVYSSKNQTQSIRDLDSVKSFMSSTGPSALFDLPWVPLYLFIIFSFHYMMGVAVIIGAVILLFLTLITELITKSLMKDINTSYFSRNKIAEQSQKNSEVLRAMGLINVFKNQWKKTSSNFLETNRVLYDVTTIIGVMSKTFRGFLQSAILGLGAYLVIKQQATGGVIIASSILTAKALGPIDLIIANWKGISSARTGWKNLRNLKDYNIDVDFILPTPKKYIMVDNVSVNIPETTTVIVEGVSFNLRSGQALGIIGSSGSGKSTLARSLVSAWPITKGTIRLDGASLDQWGPLLGKHIGYLPQDVELFFGTVAQNIGRFTENMDHDKIIKAAEAAGAHEMIVGLTNGYMTEIGDGGVSLSGGQRQRIGLARALYDNPFLIVLDEPNANLDVDGEMALSKSILNIRQRGGIAIIITHRQNVLSSCDMIMVMESGKMTKFDFKNKVFTIGKANAS